MLQEVEPEGPRNVSTFAVLSVFHAHFLLAQGSLRARATSTSHAVIDAPPPRRRRDAADREGHQEVRVFFLYSLNSDNLVREEGAVLTQVPQPLFGPLRKSAYRMSPLKNVFGDGRRR